MNEKQIEVHDYYKALHPKAMIFYHVHNQYVIFGDDVEKASKLLSAIHVLEPGVGYMPDDTCVLSVFGHDGTEVRIINYKNKEGMYVLPDIELLKSEKQLDY